MAPSEHHPPGPGVNYAPAAGPVPHALGESLRACLRQALGHELPNQVLAVQGLARVLEWEDGARLSDAGKDYLRRLAAATERIHGLVRTLADVVRPGAGGQAGAPAAFLEVARRAAADVGPMFPDRPAEYVFEEPDQFLPVPGLALRQVLVQLLRNAFQATERGQTPRVRLGARADDAGWAFWVVDAGSGFTPERLRALEEFLAGRSAAPGSEFGLLFVALVAAGWGGTLGVESQAGRGCTVTVTVPRSFRDPEASPHG